MFTVRQSLVAIGDAKKKLDGKGEGEFMKFLEALSFTSDSTERIGIRGFVYDADACSLMTAVNGLITQVTTLNWATPGSHVTISKIRKTVARRRTSGLQWFGSHYTPLLYCSGQLRSVRAGCGCVW